MDAAALREQFPALRRLAYLNAGTDGPLPARAMAAAGTELERQVGEGRTQEHFARRSELGAALRAAYGRALGCDSTDVALTTCTTEGLALVIAGLELGPGDEIVTSDEEHPGLLGALGAARDLRGVAVRVVPLAEVAAGVGPRTRLVACSHVSWMSGSTAPSALGELEVPVLLDGAQGVGAVPVDLHSLGCDAYAGSGQKWLCGPDGSGMLYVAAQLREQLRCDRRAFGNLAAPGLGLHARPHEDARSLDSPSLSAEAQACSLAAIGVLEDFGWPAVHQRASGLAARLAERLQERGREVVPRADTTLVSFASPDPEGERARLAERGVVLRNLPSTSWLRASVGAWNDEDDLERLLDGLAP